MNVVANTKRTEIGQKGAGMGPEPVISESSSHMDMAKAYNWYNYFYNDDDAKGFVITFCRKGSDVSASQAQKIPSFELHNIGWNCRILSSGGSLPPEYAKRTHTKLKELAEKYNHKSDDTTHSATVVDYTIAKANRLIADLEDHLDRFYEDNSYIFDAETWMKDNSVNPRISQIIAQHYNELLDEVVSAESAEAYDHLTKDKKKKYTSFLKSLVDAFSQKNNAAKPEKEKKVNVSKMQHHESSPRQPKDIVGKRLVYAYNTKYNRLHCFIATEGGVLSVRGTSIVGHDEARSLSAKLGTKKEAAATISKITASSTPEKVFDKISAVRKPAKARFTEHVMIIKCL